MSATTAKSILVIGDKSVVISEKAAELIDGTEIVAHVSVPREGGWGWVVTAGAFLNCFILDGITYTFGSIVNNIATGLQTDVSTVSIINALAVAMYFIAAPIASSCANRLGFRATAMTGSVITVLSCFIAFWGQNIIYLCFFYGFFLGFGFAFINLASNIVVGFYFEKLRAIAMSITTLGSSCGITAFGLINKIVADSDGWSTVVLLHSVCLGLIFFISMSFKPVLTVTVRKAGQDLETCKTITFLPTAKVSETSKSKSKVTFDTESRITAEPTKAEKVFGTAGNISYPKSSTVVGVSTDIEVAREGPSSSKGEETYEFTTYQGGRPSQAHLHELISVKSLAASLREEDETVESPFSKTPTQKKPVESTEPKISKPEKVKKKKKRRCCQRFLHWEPEVDEARPFYRDDVFYHGDVSKLPEYEKSKMRVSKETGLEFALEVSRAAGAEDLQEKRGIFTTAMRRVLASMLDVSLLKLNSYKLFCLSQFCVAVGYLVFFIYIPTWAKTVGISNKHCDLFISVVGASNALGRLSFGILASKINPVHISIFGQLTAGLTTCAATFFSAVHFVYAACFMFGFMAACIPSLRCLILVDLYGLEKLTNAVGIVLLFCGVGSLVGSPVAGILISKLNYHAGFLFGGGAIVLGALFLIPTLILAKREKKQNIKK